MYLIAIVMIVFLLLVLKLSTKISIAPGQINLLTIIIYRDFGVLTALALVFWINSPIRQTHYVIGQIPIPSLELAFYASFLFTFLILYYGFFMQFLFKKLAFRMPEVNFKSFSKIMKIWIIILLLVVIIMFFKNPPVVSQIFSGASAMDISIARSEVGSNAIFKIVRNSWVPITSYTFLFIYIKDKKFRNWFILSVVLAIICSVWSGAKSSLASLLLGYLGVYILLSNVKIGNIKILMYAILFICFIFLMYYLTNINSNNDISIIAQTAMYRFFGQAGGVGYAFYMYPNFFEFKYFTGISSFLSNMIGVEFSSVYGDLIDYAVPEFSDISGAMSSFAAGDAYGLFGWWGILLGPLFVAFYYYLFYFMAAKGNAQILFIGMYGLYFGNAYLASSFYSFVWPVGIAITIFPIIVTYLICLVRK